MTGMTRLICALAAVLMLSMAVPATTGRDIIVNVISPPLAYSDSQVVIKLQRQLSREGNFQVTPVGRDEHQTPAFPEDRYNTDSLLNWGREVGGRYLMVVEVINERLERRKSFHVPLVFHKYETVGVIDGEFRLLDLVRGRILAAEPFRIEKKGPRIFQATMDDDVNDPDLHLTAPAKVTFFDELESSLCQHLARRVNQVVGNHR